MGLLAKVTRTLCRSNLGFCFSLIVLSGFAILLINYIFKPADGGEVDYVNVPGEGRHLAGIARHHKKGHLKHHHDDDNYDQYEDDDSPKQTCKIPKLSFFKHSHKDVYHKMEPLECPGNDLFYLKDYTVHINETVLNGRTLHKCVYRAIAWFNDTHHIYSKPLTRTSSYDLKIKHDFFRVQCFVSGKEKSKAGVRHILSDGEGTNLDKKPLHQVHEGPRIVGSMGMPDPVIPKYPKIAKSFSSNTNDKDMSEIEKEENVIDDMKVRKKIPKLTQGDDLAALDEVDETIETSDEEQINDDYRQDKDNGKADYKDQILETLDSDPDFDQLIAQIFPKKEIGERNQDDPPHPESLNMNVLLLIVESMSHVCFSRKMPKTEHFLTTSLQGKVLNGYSIVGDGSSGSFLPLLTGKNESDLPKVGLNQAGSTYVDSFPLIFYDYEQKGYTTLYAEDMPDIGAFNFKYNGFEAQPVDHYMRPFWLAADQSEIKKQSHRFCLGNKPKHQFTLQYVKEFFHRYPKTPKFGLAFFGELSHEDSNPSEYLDKDLTDLLHDLMKSGHLNKTLVVLMGDHGPRHHRVRRTIQGKLEERLPVMVMAFPKWFQDNYEMYMKNLEMNLDKLVTPYDVYETLKDLIDVERAKQIIKPTDRGISLLKEIPSDRTCASAGINLHWCTCLMYEEIPNAHEDPTTQIIAKHLVKYINKQTEARRQQCQELTLKTVVDAKLILPNEKLLNFIEEHHPESVVANFSQHVDMKVSNYQVILATNPNQAVYEATIQYNANDKSFDVLPDISRLNRYNDEPKCILHTAPELRNFCFCNVERKKTDLLKYQLYQ